MIDIIENQLVNFVGPNGDVVERSAVPAEFEVNCCAFAVPLLRGCCATACVSISFGHLVHGSCLAALHEYTTVRVGLHVSYCLYRIKWLRRALC